jgi:hypothetical protein
MTSPSTTKNRTASKSTRPEARVVAWEPDDDQDAPRLLAPAPWEHGASVDDDDDDDDEEE